VLFAGDDEARRALAHAVLARLAASVPAEELLIALCVSPSRQADWAWTRWLPHTRRPPEAPPEEMTVPSTARLPDLLGEEFSARPAFVPGIRPDQGEPLVVVVLDGVDLPAGDRLATTGLRNTLVLDLGDRRRRPGRTTLRLDAGPDGVRAVWTDHDRTEGSAPVAGADATAALLAPYPGGPWPDGRRLAEALDASHPLEWAPPLTASPTIDHLLPPLVPVPDRGLTTAVPPEGGPLMVPVGIGDRPFERLRDVLRLDLSGHVLVAGDAGSGKSTLLTTLALALALTHTPREAQIYCLDPHGDLGVLAGLPHVGALAGGTDPGQTAATIAKLTTLLDHRRRLFPGHGIAGMEDYRRRRQEFPDERYGDVFLIADGLSPGGPELDEHAAALQRLAADGPAHGIHLVLAVEGPPEPPEFVRAGERLDLVLGDPDARRPGRGLAGGFPFLTALPRVDGVEGVQGLAAAVPALVAEIAEHWGERAGAPGIHVLPPSVPAHALPEPDNGLRAVIGLSDGELAPVTHDFASAPHLVVIGDAGSGKTNLLRLVAQSITAYHSPVEARILVVDRGGGLLHAMPEEFVLGHAFSPGVLGELVEGTARAIAERMAATAESARSRAWQGPRLFILVDDYEQVRRRADCPFEPLLDFAAKGYELGVHLIVASSADGAGGAMADPLLRALHDAGAGVVLLSCPPKEDEVLDGLRPADLPPGRGAYRAKAATTIVQTALAD
jgi:S-DNA-T family DNA segregation ATPase FtsK/SpoIIIE